MKKLALFPLGLSLLALVVSAALEQESRRTKDP